MKDSNNLKNVVFKEMKTYNFGEFFPYQDACYEHFDNNPYYTYIANDTNGKGSKKYTAFKTLRDYIKFRDNTPPEKRTFYEQISFQCTEYYDLDENKENDFWTKNTPHEILDIFLSLRREWGKENGFDNGEFNMKDVYILASKFPEQKVSFHITIRNDGLLFQNTRKQKEYIYEFLKFLKTKDMEFIIDKSVYSSKRCFRTLGCCKSGSDRVLKRSTYNEVSQKCDEKLFYNSYILPELKETAKKWGVKLIDDVGKDYVSGFLKYVTGYKTDLSDEDKVVIEENRKNSNKLLGNLSDVSEMVDNILEIVDSGKHTLCDGDTSKLCYADWKNLVFCVLNCCEENDQEYFFKKLFWYYRNQVDNRDSMFKNMSQCIGIYKSLDLTLLMTWAKQNPNYVTLLSRIKDKPAKKRTKDEQKFLDNVKGTILDRQIESLFKYNENEFIKIKNIPEEVKYVENINFPDNCRSIGIHAGLGRGKTTALISLVKSMDKDAKVLIVSPRITFSKNITAEYNSEVGCDRQFSCYLDYKKKGSNQKGLNFANKVVISMEGLHYLESFTPDLLIVDEANANLMSHVSDTNGKNFDNNIYQFRRMLTYSKKVVIADAFLGSKVTQLYTDLRLPLFIFKYHRKLDRKKAVFLQQTDKEVKKNIKKACKGDTEKEAKMMFESDPSTNLLKKFLKDGKKVYAFISSRKKLEAIENEFTDKYKCIFYSGVSQNEIPDNLNEAWSKQNLIATTSTITVGINHNAKNVFNTKLIDFSGGSHNNVSDAIQGHMRARSIIDDEIYISAEDRYIAPNSPINMKQFDEEIDHKSKWYKKKYSAYGSLEPYALNIIKHNYLEHQLSSSASVKMLKRYLEECNYEIVDGEVEEEIMEIDEVVDDGDGEEVDLIKELLKNEPTQTRVMELEKEKMVRKLTQKERDEIDTFWFIHMYTGGTTNGYLEAKLPIIALAYSLWKCRFSGNKTIRAMRLEKKVLQGEITVEELAKKRYDESQFADIQGKDLLKIERILYICQKLGLKHSNDTETEIPQEKMDDFYADAHDAYDSIQKDMGIQDRRKDKVKKPTYTQFKGLIKSSFTHSDHSLCNLSVIKEEKVKKDGKRVLHRTYGLQTSDKSRMDMDLVNFMITPKHSLDTKNAPNLLYKYLEIKDCTKHKRLLFQKQANS